MKKTKRTLLAAAILGTTLAFTLCGCGIKNADSAGEATLAIGSASETEVQPVSETSETKESTSAESTQNNAYFTERDLQQTPDLTDAVSVSLEDGKTITIDKAGVYVLSGTASNAQIAVDAGDEDKHPAFQVFRCAETFRETQEKCFHFLSSFIVALLS